MQNPAPVNPYTPLRTNLALSPIQKILLLTLLGAFGYLLLLGANTSREAQKAVYMERHAVLATPPIPSTLHFAGEQVPLDRPDVRQALEKELLINTYWHSHTILTIKNSFRHRDLMVKILQEKGVPVDFFFLMLAESGAQNVRSPAGAQGYWQFMPSTAQEYGLEVRSGVDERNHAERATRAACDYLLDQFERFGSWTLAAAAYNAGPAGIARELREQYVDNYYDLHLNSETSRYVFRILAKKLILKEPSRYGFKFLNGEVYKQEPFRVVTVEQSIADLPRFAREHGTTYREIRRRNPWLTDDKLDVPAGRTYALHLPLAE